MGKILATLRLSYLDLTKLSRTVTIAALTVLVIELSLLGYLLS